MATVVQTTADPLPGVDVDRITLDLVENGLRNARYEMTRCCSAPRCLPASASSTTSSR